MIKKARSWTRNLLCTALVGATIGSTSAQAASWRTILREKNSWGDTIYKLDLKSIHKTDDIVYLNIGSFNDANDRYSVRELSVFCDDEAIAENIDWANRELVLFRQKNGEWWGQEEISRGYRTSKIIAGTNFKLLHMKTDKLMQAVYNRICK